MKAITPFRIGGGILAALVVTAVILMKMGTRSYLLLPDVAHPVAPLVQVTGGKPAKGGGELFFVDVQEEKASQFDLIFQSWLHPHSTRYKATQIVPRGFTDKQIELEGLQQMRLSKVVASVVAERRLGYKASIDPRGLRVFKVEPTSHAQGILKPHDLIVAVNGAPTLTQDALGARISAVKPGTVVALRIRRGSTTQTVNVKTTQRVETVKGVRKKVTAIGIIVIQAIKVVLPVKITIDSGNIGGPSAGLAFTLEVMRRLGDDVTHGYRIAATGEMHLDGTVGAIGGIEQKTWGVREAGAQVFLVPKDGHNARDAKKFAGPDLMIIPVTSIDQALRKLAKLPKLP